MQKIKFKIFFLSFFIFQFSFLIPLRAQVNLVPNGSFETFTTCPNNTAQLEYTSNWVKCSASTDYFNSCAGGGFVSVPFNLQGYQPAAEGNGYIGIIAFALHDNGNGPTYYREPAGTFLTQTLTIGAKYFASFKVALTVNNFESCCATNKLGLRFSTLPFSVTNPIPTNNFAHIYTNTIITDTINWTLVKGSFIADSAYQFVTVGNFFDTLSTQIIDYNNDYPNTYASYYYIDDIRVSTDSDFVLSSVEPFDKIDQIFVYPNPCSEKLLINGSENSLFDVLLFNMYGENVLPHCAILNNELDISQLDAGIYVLRIKERRHLKIKSFKIQKL